MGNYQLRMTRSIIATFIFSLLTLVTSAQEVKLLLEHLYFEGEIEQDLSANNWIGLFEQDGTFSLKKCNVQIESAQHPMVDNEGEKTGLKVTSKPSGSIMLISGIEANEQLKSIELTNKEFYPNKPEQFNFLVETYELSGTGTVEQADYGDIISNYRLTLSYNGRTQILAESDFFDDAMFNIIWSGDLDGDKQLDLLIDLSYKYSFGLFSLFLSSSAGEGELVKLVSQHKIYYD